MAALRLAYAMAEPRARTRMEAEERTDAIVDAFPRVLEGINALEPAPTTTELWQRNLGHVLGDRGRPRDQYAQFDARVRAGYEIVLSGLDESLLRVILAVHDPRLRQDLSKQDRVLLQDGTEEWLRSLDWHEVRELGHAKVDPHPWTARPVPSTARLKGTRREPFEEAVAELDGAKPKRSGSSVTGPR